MSSQATASDRSYRPRQLALALDHPESFAREDFLSGRSSEAALALVDSWPDWPSRAVALIGPEGSGKTHLATIWATAAGARVVSAKNIGALEVPAMLATGALVVEDAGPGLDERAVFHLLNLAREEEAFVLITGKQPHTFQKLPSIPFLSDINFLGTLGANGLTAYFGLLDVGKPQTGETLVVSAAAGATGSIAGQLGKIHGCRVVGIADSDEKCKWIKDDLGFDAAINYKHPDWKAQLVAATPSGVDINFENVGGEIMLAVLDRMNLHGRVVLCGLISGYTREDPTPASFGLLLIKRLRVEGFIVLDYASKFMDAGKQLGMWKMTGKLKDKHTLVKGLEKAPDAINMLFRGDNIGKLIVEL